MLVLIWPIREPVVIVEPLLQWQLRRCVNYDCVTCNKELSNFRNNEAAHCSTKLGLSDRRKFAGHSVLEALRNAEHAPGHGASRHQIIVDKCDGISLNRASELRLEKVSAENVYLRYSLEDLCHFQSARKTKGSIKHLHRIWLHVL